ncbi:MAG: GntR family transcriptional regulator [Hyphomicrobiaceae bacterium]
MARSRHRSGSTASLFAEASKPPRTNLRTAQAYSLIRHRILSGDMPPDSQHLEGDLAAVLGMSRTPIREALIRLAQERFVEIRPRRGIRVLPLSVGDIQDIFDIIIDLEATAAMRAAERGLLTKQLRALDDFAKRASQAHRKLAIVPWARADAGFHRKLVEFAGNDRLSTILDVSLEQIHRARMSTSHLQAHPRLYDHNHGLVAAAIRDREPVRAHALQRDQRTRSAEALIALLLSAGLDAV